MHDLIHPDYAAKIGDWHKFALTMEGGRAFVNRYLQPFSTRENVTDFENRKLLTFSAAHAKSILAEMKNSIFQRMIDITRSGGSQSYQQAVEGELGGVSFNSDSMNAFVGNDVILDLLTFGKIGVFVDKPEQFDFATPAETLNSHPYLYTYTAPAIRSWKRDNQNTLIAVLLRDVIEQDDFATGLVKDTVEQFRLLRLIPEGVEVTFFDDDNHILGNPVVLELKRIPFVIAELSESLLQDIADYQIALLNLGSADINYAMKSNFPFYTEQYNAVADLATVTRQAADTGTAKSAATANSPTSKSGVSQGRRYPMGADRPGFINPSSEPLKISMEKQKELREEMRQMVNLSLNNLRSRSAESKKEDSASKEEGLSAIGITLETMERHIAEIWNNYEGSDEQTTVAYPTNYSIKSDEERIKEADSLNQQIVKTPSVTLRKELSKESAEILVGHKVSAETMEAINKEIDAAKVIATDPEVIRSDAEAGFVSTETSSLARGYPEGEAKKAEKDHTARLARIAAAQSDTTIRGNPDNQNDPNAVSKAREGENDSDEDDNTADKTRGKGQ